MSTDDDHATPPASLGGEVDAYGEAPAFRPAKRDPLLVRAVPVAADVPRYRIPSARRDLLAGLTVAALALPSAMAYGELAGLSPVNGLYALLLPTVAYVLLGSSRRLVIGPEGSVSTLVAASVLSLAAAGSDEAAELAAMLALLVAACFGLAWLLRLGWVADYFSRPVLIGYLHGVAIVLVTTQLSKLLGLDVDATEPLRRLGEIARELDDVSVATIAVSVVSLSALLALRRWLSVLPGALIVVVTAIGASWAFDFAGHGISVIGPVPAGLPRPTLPTPSFTDVLQLVPAALGVFLVSFADEILTARAFAGRNNEHVRASQELLVMGAANAAAGVTQAFSVGASGARTAVNEAMGARTQIAGLFAVGTVVAVLVFLTEPVQYLPVAVLGAVIVSAGINIVDPSAWRALAAIDRVEVAIAGVTVACVVIFGVLEALIVAVGLSIIDTVRRSARPYDAVLGWVPRLDAYRDVSLNPSARVTPGVVVYRLDDRLFFANARYVKGRVREAIRAAPTETSWFVFDAEAVNHVDSTGMEALLDLTRDLRKEQITLVVARLRTRIMEDFEVAGLVDEIGREHFYASVKLAVAGFGATGRETAGRSGT
jgi:high affinity sulfate transporter 1